MAKKTAQDDAARDELFNEDEDEDEQEGLEESSEPVEDGEEIDVDPAPSRREKRRGRFEDRIAQGVETKLQGILDARLASLEQLVRGAGRGQDDQGERRQGGGQGQGPSIEQINAALSKKYDDEELLERAWSARLRETNGAMPEEERRDFRKKAKAISEEQQELVQMRTMVNMGISRQQQQDPGTAQREAIRAQVQTRHNDVMTHQQSKAMIQYAEGHYRQQLALGKTDSMELNDEAMDAARVQFGMQPKYTNQRPNPSTATKARLGGTGSTGGGSSGGSKTQIKVTKALREMAKVAFPDIKDERKRLEHYAKLMKDRDK